jgi:hypothetical protein
MLREECVEEKKEKRNEKQGMCARWQRVLKDLRKKGKKLSS